MGTYQEIPPPTYYEVNRVIEKLKTHIVAGPDNIPTELIKQGGIELQRRIQKLITKNGKTRLYQQKGQKE